MAKRISRETLDKISQEKDSRVLVKKRHVPEQKEIVPVPPPAPENIKQLLTEFHDKILRDLAQPATTPVTRVIHISNIARDVDDRISAADFTVTVERKDVQPRLINEVKFSG